MSRIRPLLAFELAVTHFLLSHGQDRERLGPAIDAFKAAPEWKAAGIYTKQLVTACERALACAQSGLAKGGDLAKAVEGVQEIADLARRERNAQASNAGAAWQEELRDALPAAEPEILERVLDAPKPQASLPLDAPAAPVDDAAAAPPTPRRPRWDERADLQ